MAKAKKQKQTIDHADMLDKIRVIKSNESAIKQLQAEADEAKQAIKQVMDAMNLHEMAIDVFTIRYTDVQTDRFDSSAFKKTHQDLFDQYTKTSTSKRFTIS